MINAGTLYVAKSIAKRSAGRARALLSSQPKRGDVDFICAAELGPRIYTEVFASKNVNLTRPTGFSDADWRAFRTRDVDHVPPDFVLDLKDGCVVGREGWVGLSPRLIISDIWQERFFPSETRFRRQAELNSSADAVALRGLSASLAMPWLLNYYHWTAQALPRLRLIQSLVDLKSVDHWILPEPLPPYIPEWMHLVGIDPSRIVPTANGRIIQCERLVVSSVPGPNQYVPAWATAYVRSIVDDLPTAPGPTRLFIGRKDIGEKRRRIINGERIAGVLANAGFETVFLEDKTVAEKIALFRSADYIVGVHGAGLTNIIFCHPGARLLEITPRNMTHPTFWKLSRVTGTDHRFLLGSEPRVPFPFYAHDQRADISINPVDFEYCLQALLHGPGRLIGNLSPPFS